jgi:hypothetical protein
MSNTTGDHLVQRGRRASYNRKDVLGGVRRLRVVIDGSQPVGLEGAPGTPVRLRFGGIATEVVFPSPAAACDAARALYECACVLLRQERESGS